MQRLRSVPNTNNVDCQRCHARKTNQAVRQLVCVPARRGWTLSACAHPGTSFAFAVTPGAWSGQRLALNDKLETRKRAVARIWAAQLGEACTEDHSARQGPRREPPPRHVRHARTLVPEQLPNQNETRDELRWQMLADADGGAPQGTQEQSQEAGLSELPLPATLEPELAGL